MKAKPTPSNHISQPNAPVEKQKQPWWRWAITIAAIVLFVYIISKHWQEFINTLKTISIIYGLMGLAVLFIARTIGSARWYALLRISKKPVSYWQSVKMTYAGLFASNFLFSSIGGDLVRFIGMVQADVDSALVLASLIMDRIVGAAGMCLFIPGGIYLLFHPIQTVSLSVPRNLLVSPLTVFPNLKDYWQKFLDFVKKLWIDILFWFRHPKNILSALGYTLIQDLLLFIMFWLFLKSLGQDVSFWRIASLYSLTYLVTLIPISIGGLGIQEWAITFFFSSIGGIPLGVATALAVLNRLAFIINSLPGVIFIPDILRIQREQENSSKPELKEKNGDNNH